MTQISLIMHEDVKHGSLKLQIDTNDGKSTIKEKIKMTHNS